MPPSANNLPAEWLDSAALLDSTILGLSQISVTKPGRLAFVSGKTAIPRDRGEIPPTLAGQAGVVARNLQAVLAALSASPSDVVALRVNVVGATTERFEEAWASISEMLGSERPSMTRIGVQAPWIAELQVELEMVARLP